MTPQKVSLITVPAGEKVKVALLSGGKTFKSRITAMGLHVGLVIRVISNQSKGPIVIEAKGIRIVLGVGMTDKIGVYYSTKKSVK